MAGTVNHFWGWL